MNFYGMVNKAELRKVLVVNQTIYEEGELKVFDVSSFLSAVKISWLCRINCPGSRPKTHKRLKEHFLMRRNRTKRANFGRSPLFQATYNNKKTTIEKQTINLTYLVLVGMGEAGGRKRA